TLHSPFSAASSAATMSPFRDAPVRSTPRSWARVLSSATVYAARSVSALAASRASRGALGVSRVLPFASTLVPSTRRYRPPGTVVAIAEPPLRPRLGDGRVGPGGISDVQHGAVRAGPHPEPEHRAHVLRAERVQVDLGLEAQVAS